MKIIVLLALPLIASAAPLFFRKQRTIGIINAAGCLASLAVALLLAADLCVSPVSLFGFIYADALSGFFLLTVAVVNFASSLYSVSYVQKDLTDGAISERKSRFYYTLFNFFSFAMYAVTVLDNLGFMWVAVEMTTLASAFLVGFYNTKRSVEAAWKYVIICSVGLSFALFGTVLFYYAASLHGIHSLNWTDMLRNAPLLDPRILKVAFLFIIAGYGTKAGFAPMHTWLPDAHSQAPAPISAMLSGVLIKTSIFAILRFAVIVNKSAAAGFTGHLFIGFGGLSLLIAAGFMLAQRDIKRLLAYSTIEHVGIISLGLGFGGPLGCLGALFHIFNHAVTKSAMFFCAGSIVKRFGTNNMRKISGAAGALPFAGTFIVVAAFALGGTPPFSIFTSELMVLIAGFAGGHYTAAAILLAALGAVFAALIYYITKLSFGKKPEDVPEGNEPLGMKAALAFLAVIMLVFGVAAPHFFGNILNSAAAVLW